MGGTRRSAVALALVVLAVSVAGCQGRRGGRRGAGGDDSGMAADAGPRADGGGRDAVVVFDASGGMDSGPAGTDAGGDAAVSPDVDVSGSWSGTWSSSGLTDTATASLLQMGSTVAGTLSLNGSPCVTDGTVEATITGSDVAGRFSSGADSASFTATATSTTLAGSFTVETGTCAGIGGTFDLSR